MTFDNHLLEVINRLQDLVYNTIGNDSLDLPQIAVIGSQSSGKSSVLENIVGKDFLPRGTGIVTRRPLILQLVNLSDNDSAINDAAQNELASFSPAVKNPEDMTLEDHLRLQSGGSSSSNSQNLVEWGEFLHLPNKKFYDFQEIKKEIESETCRIAGKNKGISKSPIHLKVYSPTVLSLTLVDLPGLTKVPIGDQPTDIEVQIRSLVTEYISKPNCIILAVSPANVDLANSESLQIARQFDPQGKRTVGVLSKLDLMDHGTNALDILSGKVYPLKLGFVGVVNRSQQDILLNKSLEDSLTAENQFFQTHLVYSKISSKCGTQYLLKTLNTILMNHIRKKLPDIKAKLNTLMGQTEQDLLSYGDPLSQFGSGNAASRRSGLILKLIGKFSNNFINSLEGNQVDSLLSTKELCGGARIYYIYHNMFSKIVANIDPCTNLSLLDIRIAIRNSTGARASLFVPELAFDSLVKPQINLLLEPSIKCVELIYEELMKICHNNCSSDELIRYPKLQSKLIECVSNLLRERLGPTTQYVESLIEIHRSYINTNHASFIGAANAMNEVVQEHKIKLQAQNKNGNEGYEDENEDIDEADLDIEIEIDEVENDKKQEKENSNESKMNGNAIKDSKTSKKKKSTVIDNRIENASKESFLNFFFGNNNNSNVPGMNSSLNRNQPINSTYMNGSFLNNTMLKDDSYDNLGDSYVNSINRLPEQIEQLSLSNPRNQSVSVDELTDRELMECELIKKLIISYFNIIRAMIEDQVPKAIMCLLVNFCKDNVGNALVEELYKVELFDELLEEDRELRVEREKCANLLKTYKEASKIINEIL